MGNGSQIIPIGFGTNRSKLGEVCYAWLWFLFV